MSGPNEEKVFKIPQNRLKNPIARKIIERSLCFPQLNKLYDAAAALGDSDARHFSERLLETMRVSFSTSPENFVLPEGPVVVVANHPFGGLEGILLIALLRRLRPDAKIMANYILGMIPDLRDSFFFVDPFGGPDSKRANLRSVKASLKWVQDGHVLGLFPAGEVSSVDIHTGKVRDPAWSTHAASFIRRAKATVVPVFFGGNNGQLFNLAGLIHPRLRTVMLPKQLVNKQGRKIVAEIGRPIPWEEMAAYESDETLTQYLRLRTYILGERSEQKKPKFLPFRRTKTPKREPLIEAADKSLLAQEIDSLPADALLVNAGENKAYAAFARDIPNVMTEIGRLREETFRAVGEGTGKPLDLDEFDKTYLHLFIWNSSKREIVGAYRLGLADQIIEKNGVKGLYTHESFRFSKRLMSKISPAIELGRAFVAADYQKSYGSLLLLWRGVCTYVSRHPHYTHLFGTVSITNEYRDASRNIMLRSLRLSNFENDLARLVKPRKPPRRAKRAEWNLPGYYPYIDNIELVSKLIQEIEDDHKGVPVLLRQYLKMGGKLLSFNIDPNFNFTLDGLIAVDLTQCNTQVLKRYMGAEELKTYRAFHGISSADL